MAVRHLHKTDILYVIFSSAAVASSLASQLRVFYSPRETESILGISHASLYRLIGAGRLDTRKLGGKTLITAASIERLVTDLPKPRCLSGRLQPGRGGAPARGHARARGRWLTTACLRRYPAPRERRRG